MWQNVTYVQNIFNKKISKAWSLERKTNYVFIWSKSFLLLSEIDFWFKRESKVCPSDWTKYFFPILFRTETYLLSTYRLLFVLSAFSKMKVQYERS